jgi:hypothetical protein
MRTPARCRCEGDAPECQDAQGLHVEELVRHQLGADREAEHDGDDVDDLVLRRPAQALDHAALAHADCRSTACRSAAPRRQQQGDQDEHTSGNRMRSRRLTGPQLLHLTARSSLVVSARMIGG